MKPIFQETQRFSQWWLWLLLTVVFILVAYGVYQQGYFQNSLNSTPRSTFGVLFFLVVYIGVMLLFFIMQLKTEINDRGIHFCYRPFVSKNITWDEIVSVHVINYGFVGGWGIRLWTAYGTVYNTRGNMGMAITLKSGKKLLIGTQKPKALQDALAYYWNKK